MNCDKLLDLATEIGYCLAMSGAETFRVEDSINRILAAYQIQSEVFAIPNCMTISIKTSDGQSITRMRRVGHHGNDLDSVERFSNLSRRICKEAILSESRKSAAHVAGFDFTGCSVKSYPQSYLHLPNPIRHAPHARVLYMR